MLKNAYLLAKIGANTSDNEQNFAEILTKFSSGPLVRRRKAGRDHRALHAAEMEDRRLAEHLGAEVPRRSAGRGATGTWAQPASS